MPEDFITAKRKWRINHQPADPTRPQDSKRLDKALELVPYVTITSPNTAIVKSQTSDKEYHIVLSDDGRHMCECPDSAFRALNCKHIRALLIKKAEVLHNATLLNSEMFKI